MNIKKNRVDVVLLSVILAVPTILAAACSSEPTPEPTKAATAFAQPAPAATPSPTAIMATPQATAQPQARPEATTEPPAKPAGATPGAATGSLSRLALSMQYDPSVAALDREGDIAFELYPRGRGLRPAQFVALSSAPKGSRMLVVTSTEGVEEILDNLKLEISYLGYDLERWDLTPTAEQDRPVEAVQKMQKIAHSRGLKLFIAPTIPFNERYGKQLALYTDIYAPQSKGYQANLQPDQYNRLVRGWLQDLKAANPKVKLFHDLAPNPKGIEKTPAELLDSVIAVQDLIDGVSMFYRRDNADTVRQFVKLLGR